MQRYEIVLPSVNTRNYPKPITTLVIAPEVIRASTGVMLFSHGWGWSRLRYLDFMSAVAEQHDLLCLASEYRQSGLDFDPVTGVGYDVPYDGSFLQVFDVLNSLRQILPMYPQLNRRRIFHYGGSQGGHIALLSAIFAPNTFTAVYSSSGMTSLDQPKIDLCGRCFSPAELSARDVCAHAAMIQCPLFLEHGTADENVNCEQHAGRLEKRLQNLYKTYTLKYYAGGGHSLAPAISKKEAFLAMLPALLATPDRAGPDDFQSGSQVLLPCGESSLQIDWSKAPGSTELFSWVCPPGADKTAL
ncbi:MAG: DUF2920 family protein [Oligosphaeraceae bacterium]|nr:DUF2920 family protein [Oligosphaeraceae bacterium]